MNDSTATGVRSRVIWGACRPGCAEHAWYVDEERKLRALCAGPTGVVPHMLSHSETRCAVCEQLEESSSLAEDCATVPRDCKSGALHEDRAVKR